MTWSILAAEERKAAGGEINPEVEKLIPGGLRSAAHLTSRSNMQELFREMLLPSKDGSGGAAAGGGSKMENVMSAMLMMQLMGQMSGGQGGMFGMGNSMMGGQPNVMMGGPMGVAPRMGMPGAPMMPVNPYMPNVSASDSVVVLS